MLGDIGEGNSRRQDSQDGELRNVGLLRDHTAPDIYPDKSAFYTENNMTYQASQIETTGLGLSSSEQADSSGLTVDSAARRKHKGKERALDDEFEGQDQSPKSPALLLSPASSPESYPIDFRYGSALQNSDADEEYPPTTDSAKEYRVIEQVRHSFTY